MTARIRLCNPLWLALLLMSWPAASADTGAAGHDICFLHPKASAEFPIAGEGVLIELVQAPPEVVAALREAS